MSGRTSGTRVGPGIADQVELFGELPASGRRVVHGSVDLDVQPEASRPSPGQDGGAVHPVAGIRSDTTAPTAPTAPTAGPGA